MNRSFPLAFPALALLAACSGPAGSPGDDAATCTPQCGERVCGDDGCGGSCGTCEAGQGCDEAAGACVACEPACAGRDCGDDGCGGSCGECTGGKTCNPYLGRCGGGCTPDCTGKTCGDDGCGGSCGDCVAPLQCEQGQCGAPVSCVDGKRNGGETDVDCGGGCPAPCGVGKGCVKPADCGSGDCQGGTCQPDKSCENLAQDPGETDVDCGGSKCPPCALTKFCKEHADCLSEACIFGMCKEPSCTDQARNQGESDTDCGGPCPGCADGKSCGAGADCASGDCAGGRCISCQDGQKNGKETDVDCGGACKKCALGKGCAKPGDCSSGACDGGSCCTPNACGQCVATPEEVCDGKDNDCDGQTDEASQIGSAPSCPLQKGVCAGAWADCRGAAGWGCDAATYKKHAAAYEAVEASCDGKDNDCDGETDEGLRNACGACGPTPVETCNGRDDDCNGQTDDLAACAACATPGLRTLADTGMNAASRDNVARADGRIWTAWMQGYNLVLAELVDGETGPQDMVATVWNPSNWGRGPQVRSDGSRLHLAYRTSQLSDECLRVSAAAEPLASKQWSVDSDTEPETPRIAVSPAGVAVLYQSKTYNGSYYVTSWNVGFWAMAGSWTTTDLSSWYSEYVGSTTELAVLASGETLILNTVDVAGWSYRSSKDGFKAEHKLDGAKPERVSTTLGPDGTLHVVTTRVISMVGYETGYRTLSKGTWSAEEVVGSIGDAAVALDPAGRPHVAGTDEAGVGVWTRVDGAWTRVASFAQAEGGFGYPSLAVDGAGRYHVTLSRMGFSPPNYGFFYVMLCPTLD